MKKQMKRTVYEAPVTERFQVELEANFCGSADVANPNSDLGQIEGQDVNTDFAADFGSSSWDSDPTVQ